MAARAGLHSPGCARAGSGAELTFRTGAKGAKPRGGDGEEEKRRNAEAEEGEHGSAKGLGVALAERARSENASREMAAKV